MASDSENCAHPGDGGESSRNRDFAGERSGGESGLDKTQVNLVRKQEHTN